MNRWNPVFLLLLVCAVSACGGGHGETGTGQILMETYFDEEFAIRSVAPMHWAKAGSGTFFGGSSLRDFGILVQQGVIDISREEGYEMLLDSLGLEALPERSGVYRSPEMQWELYLVEFEDQGILPMKGNLALSMKDSAMYVVFVGSQSYTYDEHPALYDRVFYQAVYAFTPVENGE